jgi:hypothetical protein
VQLSDRDSIDKKHCLGARVTKKQIVEKIKEILRTDADLDFLLGGLQKKELETLISSIRDRVDHLVQK